MKNVSERLTEYASSTSSKWREEAQERIDNRSWLRLSQHIALLMLDKMEELGMTQKQLAEKMNCTQQYVSKILNSVYKSGMEPLDNIF